MSEVPVDEERAQARGDLILITDASAEGHSVAGLLRERGYLVLDVPLMLLDARVIGESPRVVLLDVDQVGAIERAERLFELPNGGSIELLLIGDPLRAAELGRSPTDASVFARPIDVDALLDRIGEVARPAPGYYSQRGTTPPPSYAPRRETSPPVPRDSEIPPVSDLPPLGDPLEPRSILPGVDEAMGAVTSSISPELEQLLRAAEERVGASSARSSSIPSPDQEMDMLLPLELLAPLDEPLDADEEDIAPPVDSWPRRPTESATGVVHASSHGTGEHAALDKGTHTGTSPGTSETGIEGVSGVDSEDESPPTELFDASSDRLERLLAHNEGAAARSVQASGRTPPTGMMALGAQIRGAATDVPGHSELYPFSSGSPAGVPPSARSVPLGAASSSSRSAPSVVPLPGVFAEGEEARVVALAIGGRMRGSLAITTLAGTRRIVLNDGDIVTAASDIDEESLLSFLTARGDLDLAVAHRLEGKLPASGRHAGAALIAHGHLGQDDLWPVLRAHAEWIIGRTLVGGAGTAEREEEPPGRLRAEPNVFGGATGAEVFVETIRRVVPLDIALDRLGGPHARISEGPRAPLLGECALAPHEDSAARAAAGHSVGELVAMDPEMASTLYGLALLDVLAITQPVGAPAMGPAVDFDPLDEEAVRQRVRARMALVEEGDYFQILGVPRTATSYEIRRAYVDLRRTFEPSRLLTARTADLLDDVRLIAEMLDEAYEILRDQRRKERYRRAIEAGAPP